METRVLKVSEASTLECAHRLQQNEPVALPTETVYGLAANGLNEIALRTIFEVKGRPLIDPLILHFKNLDQIKEYVIASPLLDTLAAAFWPGPLTLIVQKKSTIPDLATAGMASVAVRIPSNPAFKAVLESVSFPLAAPSANPFGYVSPTCAEHVLKTLGGRISTILDGGPTNFGIESTILDVRRIDSPRILRHGPILTEEIEAVIGRQLVNQNVSTQDANTSQIAPGQLKQHYSPNTTVELIPYGSWKDVTMTRYRTSETNKIAYVYTQKPELLSENVYWLSETGNVQEIAHNLFATLQKLDQLSFETLRVEMSNDISLGLAINDRLRRAAAKFNV